MENSLTVQNNQIDKKRAIKQEKLTLQAFVERLNKNPEQSELSKTPDGKAFDYSISFVEMTLDEMFLGMWSTKNFKWNIMQNEVQGSLDLEVFHPVANQWITRVGAGSIVIMVDALSEEQKKKMTAQERNLYALDVANKKSNALDMAFPKLKAECLKNAAKSLGKAFGRDLNRKLVDNFKRQIKEEPTEELTPTHPKWKDAVLWLKNNPSQIEGITTNFIVSNENKNLLMDLALAAA